MTPRGRIAAVMAGLLLGAAFAGVAVAYPTRERLSSSGSQVASPATGSGTDTCTGGGCAIGASGISTDGGLELRTSPLVVRSAASTNLGVYVDRSASANAGVCFSGLPGACRGHILDTGTAQATIGGDNILGLTMGRMTASTFYNLPATSEFEVAGLVYLKATAPTITSACTSPTVTHGLSPSFQVDVGSSCTGVTTIVLGLPAATNGWNCSNGYNKTTATVTLDQTADTTTSATLVNTAKTTGLAVDFVDGADLVIGCVGR